MFFCFFLNACSDSMSSESCVNLRWSNGVFSGVPLCHVKAMLCTDVLIWATGVQRLISIRWTSLFYSIVLYFFKSKLSKQAKAQDGHQRNSFGPQSTLAQPATVSITCSPFKHITSLLREVDSLQTHTHTHIYPSHKVFITQREAF